MFTCSSHTQPRYTVEHLTHINPQGTRFLQRRQVTLRPGYALLNEHPILDEWARAGTGRLFPRGDTLHAVPWLLTRTHVHSEVGACLALHARASASTCAMVDMRSATTAYARPDAPKTLSATRRPALATKCAAAAWRSNTKAGLLIHKLKHTSNCRPTRPGQVTKDSRAACAHADISSVRMVAP